MSRTTRARIEQLLDLLSVPPDVAEQICLTDDLPQRIGRFPILRRLGRGGFASVLLAYDDQLERPVAIKMPHQRGEQMLVEARRLASLRHPHIMTVHDVVAEPDGSFFLVCEYLEGGSLADRFEAGLEYTPSDAVRLMIDVADAVGYAHGRGIVHRDLKPENVLLDAFGRPHVADFGLAAATADAPAPDAGVGTLEYMPPEQVRTKPAPPDCRSDVWSLGAMLYELLTGRPPFSATLHSELVQQISSMPVDGSSLKNLPFAAPVEPIIQKCLAKNPAHRFQNAAQFRAALETCLGSETSQAMPSRWPSLGRRTRGSARWGAAALLLVALFVLFSYRGRVAPSSRLADVNLPAVAAPNLQGDYEHARRMRAAYSAWENADVRAAIENLDAAAATPEEPKLHNFEYHYLRRLCAGSPKSYSPHQGRVYSVAFEPDGTRVAAASADGTVSVFDVATDQLVRRIQVSAEAVYAVCWNPDATVLATAGEDARIRLWDATTGEPCGMVESSSTEIVDLEFSPDGTRLAAAAADGQIAMWEASAGHRLIAIDLHHGPLHCLTFSGDSQQLFSAGEDGLLAAMPTTAPYDAYDYWKSDGRLFALAASPVDDLIAVGSETIIYLFDDKHSTRTTLPLLHRNTVRALAFSPDGSLLASASDDQTIGIWDIESRSLLRTYRGHVERIYGLSFSADGQWLASGGKDSTLRVWQPHTRQDRITLFEAPSVAMIGVQFSPSSNEVAALIDDAAGNPVLKAWRLDLPASPTMVEHTLQLPASRLSLARVAADSFLDGARPVAKFPVELPLSSLESGRFSDCLDAKISPSTRLLVVADDREAVLYDATANGAISQLPGQRCIAIAPDERRIAVESSRVQFAVEIWDTEQKETIATLVGHTAQLHALAFSPDGQHLLSASADSTARLWDVRDGTLIRTFRDHAQGVADAAFHPAGTRVVTGGGDGRAVIWDIATGQPVLSLTIRPKGQVRCVDFSPDGEMLAAGSVDHERGYLELWHAPNSERVRPLP